MKPVRGLYVVEFYVDHTYQNTKGFTSGATMGSCGCCPIKNCCVTVLILSPLTFPVVFSAGAPAASTRSSSGKAVVRGVVTVAAQCLVGGLRLSACCGHYCTLASSARCGRLQGVGGCGLAGAGVERESSEVPRGGVLRVSSKSGGWEMIASLSVLFAVLRWLSGSRERFLRAKFFLIHRGGCERSIACRR